MIKRPDTRGQRIKRHNRVRGKISGTAERPRLSVFRSKANIYAQIIDDVAGTTLVSASTVEKAFQEDRCCHRRARSAEGHRGSRVRPWRLYLSRPCQGSG